MNWGHLYVLSNPTFDKGVVKIGYTEGGLEDRKRQLFTTGLPAPFETEFSVYTPYAKQTEKFLKNYCRKRRVHKRREFFQYTPTEMVKEILDTGLPSLYARAQYYGDLSRKDFKYYRKPNTGKGYWNFKSGTYVGECVKGVRKGRGTLFARNGLVLSGIFNQWSGYYKYPEWERALLEKRHPGACYPIIPFIGTIFVPQTGDVFHRCISGDDHVYASAINDLVKEGNPSKRLYLARNVILDAILSVTNDAQHEIVEDRPWDQDDKRWQFYASLGCEMSGLYGLPDVPQSTIQSLHLAA